MVSPTFGQFLQTTLVLLTFALVALVTPPDPYSQMLYAVPLLCLVPVVAYLHSYRGWFDNLLAKL